MRSQHCGYWCPGAKAPGHQYPQCWLNIHGFDQFHMKILHLWGTTLENKKCFEKKWSSRLRVKLNYCKSFDDQASINEINMCLIYKWAAKMTGYHDTLNIATQRSTCNIPHSMFARQYKTFTLWLQIGNKPSATDIAQQWMTFHCIHCYLLKRSIDPLGLESSHCFLKRLYHLWCHSQFTLQKD